MDELEFTQQQRNLIDRKGSLFVEACPGAGKTQAVAQRFIERPNRAGRRGVALLSFTRAATDEARRRCSNNPGLLETPNFLGTIDSFINRFVVAPCYIAEAHRVPTFRDSWINVPASSFNINSRQTRGIDFEMDWFDFDVNGSPSLKLQRVPWLVRRRVSNLPQGIKDAACKAAETRWHRLVESGLIDCSRARLLMRRYLEDVPLRQRMGNLIRDRFHEVIVDEVQDCDEGDTYLLNFIRESQLHLVMVGDLEQSIYGFRGSQMAGIRALAASVPEGARFNSNFRSSPSICKIIDSLRHGDETDQAVGEYGEIQTPTYLAHVPHLETVQPEVEGLLASVGHELGEFIYLSHAEWAARTCAGASTKGTSSNSRLVRLGVAAASIAHLSVENSSDRGKALQSFQRTMRDVSNSALHNLGDAEFFDAIRLSPRAFQEGCVRLALRVDPRKVSPVEFLTNIREGVEQLGWSGWLQTSRLRAPLDGQWPEDSFPEAPVVRWSTIHKFKGLEFPGVGLVIPKRSAYHSGSSGVEQWANSEDGELRRVLYVGASRARRLLVLIIADRDDFTTVQKILERDSVPFLVIS